MNMRYQETVQSVASQLSRAFISGTLLLAQRNKQYGISAVTMNITAASCSTKRSYHISVYLA